MKTYEVIRDCVGFQGKRWRKGETVPVGNNVIPPHHFKQIGNNAEKKPEPVNENAPVALSQVHKVVKPNSGFAYKAEEAAPKVPKTRGRKKKN